MRILFIRHGDPDYVNDTLTEKGHREATLLANIAESWHMGDCYVSPLGRAQDTAAYSLKKLGSTGVTLDWLQEFPAALDINGRPELQQAYPDTYKSGDRFGQRIVWDCLPSYWTAHPEYLDPQGWRTSKVADCSDLVQTYDRVTAAFDELLARYGYVREDRHYRVDKECTGTITFFCHFGISAALLSHLWNLSPFTLFHSLALAPSSVTEIVTEERQQGIAYFRALRIGDTRHLFLGNEEPSFAARFCEVYSNKEQRH
ncbi:MAG: histidine phosphatase family protein [Lachnospiraceae bacterium]|nr:histidine phosphatase family protein [Lachnospiraceae bacterium]